MAENGEVIAHVRLALSAGGFLLAMVGGIVARDRQVTKRISDCSAKVHTRVDELKDEMNSNFARKDDMKESVRRVERGIGELGAEMRQNHKDLTSLIIKELK